MVSFCALHACAAPEARTDTAATASETTLQASASAANAADSTPPLVDVVDTVEPTPLPLPIATPPADEAPPSVLALRAYFDRPPLDKALKDYLVGDNVAASQALRGFAEEHPDDARARPARFIALLADRDAGIHTPTAAALEAFADEWPIMADYAWFHAGSAHAWAGRNEAAARAFERVPVRSTLWVRAQVKKARALAAAGEVDPAIKALERATKRAPNARSTPWTLLIDLYTQKKRRRDARHARIEVATRFARSQVGRDAFDALGKKPRLIRDQRFRLGKALHRAQRHAQAVATLQGVKRKDPNYCEARYLLGRTREKMKRHALAWKNYEAALACKGDVHADATFVGGRNRLKMGELDRALELLNLHIKRYPKRSTVDDVLVLIAEAHRNKGEDKAADAALMRILDERPDGDQIDEATWQLVWPRILAGDHKDALALLDKVIARVDRESHYRAEGRSQYWRGRMLAKLDRGTEAQAAYRAVFEDYPLSWYALLAYQRLRADDVDGADKVLAEVLASAAPPPDPLAAIPADLWGDPHFRKALELARMGLGDSARTELQAAPRPSGDARRAAVWTQVALYQMAGAYPHGMRLARREEPRFGAVWPVGHHAKLWEMAHPRPFRELVETWADERGIDPHWLWSIMREESNFNPEAESWANAIGLMQIIKPTAEFLAKGTEIDPTRANLQKPEVAIELGSKYLAKLLGEHPAIPLASAGYNAGGGAVRRWRRQFGDEELDMFVERITFREARGYAKRVTRSVARYTWLYGGGKLLPLDLSAPGKP